MMVLGRGYGEKGMMAHHFRPGVGNQTRCLERPGLLLPHQSHLLVLLPVSPRPIPRRSPPFPGSGLSPDGPVFLRFRGLAFLLPCRVDRWLRGSDHRVAVRGGVAQFGSLLRVLRLSFCLAPDLSHLVVAGSVEE